jgi:hypothetical protein
MVAEPRWTALSGPVLVVSKALSRPAGDRAGETRRMRALVIDCSGVARANGGNMSRIRLLMLSCMALLVVSAIGASSAFATFEKTAVECVTTGVPTVCLAESETGKLFEAKGTETILSSSIVTIKPSILKVASIGLEIECTSDGGEGEISQPEPLVKGYTLKKFFLTFKGCAVIGAHAAECKVVEPIKTKALAGTLSSENEIEAKPESGTTFAEIEIGNKTGTCPATIKGVNPVKGNQECSLPENKVDLKRHVLACAANGTSTHKTQLEFGSNLATFEGEASFEFTSGAFNDSVLS